MAARYGVREGDVDRLLRDGVFVDLYPVVRRALRVGSRSYSIKKLEPLYMGDEVRTSDVQRGDDSIVKYVEARALAADGEVEAAQRVLDDLADYNRYDCVSTRALRDWLVERAREGGAMPARGPTRRAGVRAVLPCDRAAAVGGRRRRARRDGPAPRRRRDRLLPREEKTYWATHFLRLREPSRSGRTRATSSSWMPRAPESWRTAHRGVGARRRAPPGRGARRGGSRQSPDRGCRALRSLRPAGAVPPRRPSALDPRRPPGDGAGGARRWRDHRGGRRRRRDVDTLPLALTPPVRAPPATSRRPSTRGRMPCSLRPPPSRRGLRPTSSVGARRARGPARSPP